MKFPIELILLIGSFLFFVSILVGKASHKFGVPVLLLFLLVGMVFGEDGIGVEFADIQIAHAIGIICLCVILFSGGLNTKFKDIKPIIKEGAVLATAGVLFTAVLLGLFTKWLVGNYFTSISIGLLTSLLLGSIVSSTDSASLFGILRSRGLSLKHNLRPMLEFESGSNDPVAYLLTITLIGIINSGTIPHYGMVALDVCVELVVGALFGFFLGKLSLFIINRINLSNEALYPVLLLIVGIFVFSVTFQLHGNGYLAVYIAGLVIGNGKFMHKRRSMKFMEGFAWMSQILLFLTLGLLVNPSELVGVIVPGIIIALFLTLIARPAVIFLCLAPFRNVTSKDKLYISWVGLRGAVPIIFAILPLSAKIPGATTVFNIVFVITIVSLLLQGTTLPFFARLLGLAENPEHHKVFEEFEVDFAEEIKSVMTEINITDQVLAHGKNLMELPLPEKTLAVMVKRGNRYFVPTGKTALFVGDILLVISDNEDALKETYNNIGIFDYSYQRNK